MIELVNSGVVYNDVVHSYHLNGKKLSGITDMIKNQLFPDKYKDVPKYILDTAKARGTKIHHECQDADELGIDCGSVESQNYTMMRETAGYKPLANEYTVTDGVYFASNIDCVWVKDGRVSLADIKTTYKPDIPYLTWQLSIYAYLFEHQNPTLKVENLYGAWVHKDEYKLIPLERVPDADVERLLDCERNGKQYLSDEKSVEKKDDAVYIMPQDVVDQYVSAMDTMKALEPVVKNFKEGLKKAMDEHGIKSWDIGKMKATITPEGTKKTFDAKAFQSDHPDLYKEYLKESKTSASIRITIREEDKE